ncbi:hypothetical protein U9M48_030964, partial [Paspalum notatum var. saurae]
LPLPRSRGWPRAASVRPCPGCRSASLAAASPILRSQPHRRRRDATDRCARSLASSPPPRYDHTSPPESAVRHPPLHLSSSRPWSPSASPPLLSPYFRQTRPPNGAAIATTLAAAADAAAASLTLTAKATDRPVPHPASSGHLWASLSLADGLGPGSVEPHTGAPFPTEAAAGRHLLDVGLRKTSILGPKYINVYAFGCRFVYGRLSIRSVRSAFEKSVERHQRVTSEETVSKEHAMWFPSVGSDMHLSLFLQFKFVSKDLVNAVLTVYFFILGIAVLLWRLQSNLVITLY